MTEREALKLAFEALHGFIPYLPLNDEEQCGRYDKAITAIKEALAQPEPLPWTNKMCIDVPNQPLYTAPQRTWVGLTDEEVESLQRLAIDSVDANGWGFLNRERFAYLIEIKLKEKNT